jgi:hypothetical protein
MPALPTIVTDFLTRIKDNLSVGSDLATPGSGNIRGAAINYLRAQDMASVLELLQDGLNQVSALTATGGTAISVQDTGAFVADSQIGNYAVFTGDTTPALAGVRVRVISNTTDDLFFAAGALPATPVAGDTYTIEGGLAEEAINDLREGGGSADAPAGNVYGDARVVADALNRLTVQLGAAQVERNIGRPGLLVAAGSTVSVVKLATAGVPYRIDELRGVKITVSGFESRFVVRNDGDSVTVNAPYASAPTAATAVTLKVAANSAYNPYGAIQTHPGGQPGENVYLATLIAQAEAAVVAFTLPT